MEKIFASGAFKPNSNQYWATWSILDACNYSCWYCPIKKNEYASDKIIDDTINFLHNISTNKDMEVTLFGGEPSIHPKLDYICDKLNKFCDIRIFTNFSLNTIIYENLIEKYNVKYSISYHPDMISDNKFIDSLDVFKYKNNIGHINIMYVNNMENMSMNVAEYCRKYNIPHRISPIHDLGNLSSYIFPIKYSHRKDVITVKDTVIAQKNNKKWYSDEECRFYGYNKFNGYICYKGYSSCFITHHGNVYKCLRDMEEKNFLTIYDDINDILSYENCCPYESCICENYIPKEIMHGYANELLQSIKE